ncbi:NF-kappa-B inhibitor alpha [Bagarius yarrelli]|uniref:NF-kappa-B inhibitor alpha n=1 Tax=Bagarius yarrelli TaxID=175774 RepID=A0A556VCG0_BAGYA|nr:NF-kappa-B inhibitor alpha [Bagarius yarrelli]
MELKNPRHSEERLDSGVDSMKEEEYQDMVEDMKELELNRTDQHNTHSHQSWKHEVTEDGDTQISTNTLPYPGQMSTKSLPLLVRSPPKHFLILTALHLAVIMEQPRLVEKLLKAGCDSRLVDQSGNTALHIACRRGSLSCFSVLTQINTQHLRSILSVPNYSGHTCLHIAAVCGFLSLVENLVQLGADINAKEQCSGRTSLHLAVDLQNLALVQQLIALGADVNSVTYGGYVPYHLTFGRQNGEIRQQLFVRTASDLLEFPDSESDSEDELMSDDECGYDDIQFVGK